MRDVQTGPAAGAGTGRRALITRPAVLRLLILLVSILVAVLIVRLTGVAELAFYHPDRSNYPVPEGGRDVWIQAGPDRRLHGLFLRASDAAPGEKRPVIVHAHGNAGDIGSHLDFSSFLTESGCHVLLFDYRSYGQSDPAEGSLRRGMLLEDTLAVLDYAAKRPDVLPERIGLYGVSLGGSFALAAAAERPEVRSVATVSAFSSWQRVANDHVPVLGWLLMPSGVDGVDAAARLGGRPYLIVHGMADEIVPVAHAGRLAAAAGGADAATVMLVPGADHNGITQSHAKVREALVGFFRRTLRD